jgi:hypothetical protein
MRLIIRNVVILLFGFGCCEARAATLGNSFDSFRDLHRDTAYGSLFFNETAIRRSDDLVKKRFRAVTGAGDIELPAQQGYCFVFNHYGRPNDDGKASHTYRAKISKTFADGRTAVELFQESFSPTDELTSSNSPNVCIAGIRNVSKVTIDFGSDDSDYFDWHISFVPK